MTGRRYGKEPDAEKGAERDAGPADDEVGLCARCRHAARLHSARGSTFWRCRAAERDPALPRYPPLPVRRCRAFAPEAGS